jgi:HEAT repeat protein
MKKRLAIFSGILLAGVIVGIGYWVMGKRQPCYEGKPSSYWSEKLYDEDESVRLKAVEALGTIGARDPAALDVLAHMLEDREKVKSAGRKVIRAALIQLLKHKNLQERESAVVTLGSMGKDAKQAAPALVELLKDEEISVRREAAWALGEIEAEAKDAAPALISALKDMDFFDQAGKTLEKMGVKALPFLIRALNDKNDDVRSRVIKAIGKLGPEAVEAVPALIKVVKEDKFVSLEAAGTLGDIGPKAAAAIPALIARLKEAEPIRKNAAWVLGRIHPEPKTALAQLSRYLEPSIKQTCRQGGRKALAKTPSESS